MTVLRVHAGLRVEGRQLQERLHFLQGMLPVEHGMFFSLEGGLKFCFYGHMLVSKFGCTFCRAYCLWSTACSSCWRVS